MLYFGHAVGIYINLWQCASQEPWDEAPSAEAHLRVGSLQGPEYHVNEEQLSQVILSRTH